MLSQYDWCRGLCRKRLHLPLALLEAEGFHCLRQSRMLMLQLVCVSTGSIMDRCSDEGETGQQTIHYSFRDDLDHLLDAGIFFLSLLSITQGETDV